MAGAPGGVKDISPLSWGGGGGCRIDPHFHLKSWIYSVPLPPPGGFCILYLLTMCSKIERCKEIARVLVKFLHSNW